MQSPTPSRESAIKEFLDRIGRHYDLSSWPVEAWASSFADWAIPRYEAISALDLRLTDRGVESRNGLLRESDWQAQIEESAAAQWPDPYPIDPLAGRRTVAQVNASEVYSIVGSRAARLVIGWLMEVAYAKRTPSDVAADTAALAVLREKNERAEIELLAQHDFGEDD